VHCGWEWRDRSRKAGRVLPSTLKMQEQLLNFHPKKGTPRRDMQCRKPFLLVETPPVFGSPMPRSPVVPRKTQPVWCRGITCAGPSEWEIPLPGVHHTVTMSQGNTDFMISYSIYTCILLWEGIAWFQMSPSISSNNHPFGQYGIVATYYVSTHFRPLGMKKLRVLGKTSVTPCII